LGGGKLFWGYGKQFRRAEKQFRRGRKQFRRGKKLFWRAGKLFSAFEEQFPEGKMCIEEVSLKELALFLSALSGNFCKHKI
jgi:hypothetical protein